MNEPDMMDCDMVQNERRNMMATLETANVDLKHTVAGLTLKIKDANIIKNRAIQELAKFRMKTNEEAAMQKQQPVESERDAANARVAQVESERDAANAERDAANARVAQVESERDAANARVAQLDADVIFRTDWQRIAGEESKMRTEQKAMHEDDMTSSKSAHAQRLAHERARAVDALKKLDALTAENEQQRATQLATMTRNQKLLDERTAEIQRLQGIVKGHEADADNRAIAAKTDDARRR